MLNYFDLRLKNYGYFLLSICIVLNTIGLIFVNSSTPNNPNNFISQLLSSLLSLFFCVIISVLDLKKVMSKSYHFMFMAIAVLVLVRIIGTASGRNSMRWIMIPVINVELQPTEFVKLLVILFMAKYLEKMDTMINIFSEFMKVVMWFMVPFLLIVTQPNLSSSLILLFIFISMLFVSKLKVKWFVFMALSVIILYGTLYFVAKNNLLEHMPLLRDYQKQRIASFFDPESHDQAAFQQENSVMAIGSGQFLGKGINNDSPQSVKNGNWLIEARNDFIFAVVGEEVGFLGSTIIILLFIFLVTNCLVIAGQTREEYKKFICVGIATWIGFQTFINIGVATSMIPNTGIPLPFFSKGGSAILSIYMAMGFVLNIKRDV